MAKQKKYKDDTEYLMSSKENMRILDESIRRSENKKTKDMKDSKFSKFWGKWGYVFFLVAGVGLYLTGDKWLGITNILLALTQFLSK
jgi:hypothetical protein